MNSEHIRNFVVISHVDHGKSTLADRFLELTGTVEKRKMREQFLDQMELEREKGITIKMQPVRMVYKTPIDADQNADTRGLLYEELTYKIRGAAFSIYNKLGPAFKESIYQKALIEELQKAGLPFEKEKTIDITYEGKKVGTYRPDFIVNGKIIIEIKALPFIGKLEKKQTWHYLKGSPYRLALLINFGSSELQIERIVYDYIRDNPRIDPRESAQVEYILNLIDTPGHADFTYEVSRALAAAEGAVLLVDGTQGIQAQTVANLMLAKKENLLIIPAINKIDLPFCRIEETKEELKQLTGCNDDDIYLISGKTGEGVRELLSGIIKKIPPPVSTKGALLRALIFDSQFDVYKGVIAHVRVFDGEVRAGEKLKLSQTGVEFEALETGIFQPQLLKTECLEAGGIGYVASGIKEPREIMVGDTITRNIDISKYRVEPLPGYAEPKAVVFASVYQENADEYERFRDALKKLKLNDASLFFEPETSASLGRGFRMGFLGMLHLEITGERLRREYGLPLIFSTPSVSYKIRLQNGVEMKLYSAARFPENQKLAEIAEPWVGLTVITSDKYIGSTMKLLEGIRGKYVLQEHLGFGRIEVKYEAPLSEIIVDFYDRLKAVTEGYGSMSYELIDFRPGNLVKLDILIAGERHEAFSSIVPRDRAYEEGRRMTSKLKESLPRQLFPVAIQAAIGSDIIARETLPAIKKDVTGYLYGGDRTRKMKLWKKQQRGKKRLKEMGRVEIPQEVFLKMLRK